MPDPKLLKPWHGIPREEIKWNPTVDIEACIGCGTCVTGCSRLVYRYDYEKRKPVVVDPLNCMVGCTYQQMIMEKNIGTVTSKEKKEIEKWLIKQLTQIKMSR